MKYTNPVIKGFYPDPSVCKANGKYYLVSSTFQYFPGVALFESENLINWTQIGYVLTRKNQVQLDKIGSSGGVFAPTIRYNDGRFYMVTTNDTTHQNFYVYTDDIYGEWSDPIFVDQGGIDPSLYFEDGRTYFMSNGADDEGEGGVVQCEIDIKTGEKLSKSKCVWKGSGGRFLESPHLYKIGEYYYLTAAEGGTEYGHMITYARGNSVWGPFENYAENPVLTNRDKAPFIIQGIGHGDLICDYSGSWHILSLGFRQLHIWMPYHHLGREVFLTPVKFDRDGWFTAGNDGTTDAEYEIAGDFSQTEKRHYSFEECDYGIDWCYLRHPCFENYDLRADGVTLRGTEITLDDTDSPTFLALRQRDFCFEMKVSVRCESGEGGISIYHDENEHFDVALRKNGDGKTHAVLKLNIGGIKHLQNAVEIDGDSAVLCVNADNFGYDFGFISESGYVKLGYGISKYLSSEVCGGFTGTMIALYAIDGVSDFTRLDIQYK